MIIISKSIILTMCTCIIPFLQKRTGSLSVRIYTVRYSF